AMSAVVPRLFRQGVRYYKIGVGLIELLSVRHSQLDLFTPPTAKPALMQALDGINQRYGSDNLFVATQGITHKWAMRRDLLTPQYTTKWHSIPRVKC
ncbi:MAG: DUF4113 domain-containing protein, partial [Shewanella sp.]